MTEPPSGLCVLRQLARAIVRAARLPPREMLTTVRVLVTITAVELLIGRIRLTRLSRVLGCPITLAPMRPDVEPISIAELPPAGRRQVHCTVRVANRWPFASGPCLRHALVGGHLLRRLEPSLRLGVGTFEDELSAHAWLEIDGRPLELVDGYKAFQQQWPSVVE